MENDPEGAAFEYEVFERADRLRRGNSSEAQELEKAPWP
jgi:hypothetical protein